MNSNSDSVRPQGGFTLLELVIAITLFAFIIVQVLADREESIRMSGRARTIQTVRYLAASKIDEVRYDPERFGDSDSGDFTDLDPDEPTYADYTWDLEIKKVVAIGSSDDSDSSYMFEDDEDAEPATNSEGEAIEPRYVRKMTLTVNYAPRGEVKPDLSIRIVTYLPPGPEDEEEQ